ncbi:MAG: hypothetical protein R3F13_13915 [Prosthecobacter sp.]
MTATPTSTDLFTKQSASMKPSVPVAELDFGVDERDWGAMKMLLDEFERELSERRTALLARLSIWKMAVRILKRSTTDKMILKTPSQRDYDYHHAILGFLKGTGLLLQGELKRHQNIDPENIGVSYEDLAAMVSELEYQEREWYGDMTDEFRDRMLADVFAQS